MASSRHSDAKHPVSKIVDLRDRLVSSATTGRKGFTAEQGCGSVFSKRMSEREHKLRVRDAFGDALFYDLVFFFRSVFLSDKYDIKIFLSRRSYALMRIFSDILGLSSGDVYGEIINDTAIPFLQGEIAGKRVLLADDVLMSGGDLLSKRDLVESLSPKSVDCLVFAKNKYLQGANNKNFYDSVESYHELGATEMDMFGDRVVNSFNACNFAYTSIFPAIFLDGLNSKFKEGLFSAVLRESHGYFEESYYNDYSYAEEKRGASFFQLSDAAMFEQGVVSDAFFCFYEMEGTATVVPFIALNEQVLGDKESLEKFFYAMTGEKITPLPPGIQDCAWEGAGNLLTYSISLLVAQKLWMHFNGKNSSDEFWIRADLAGARYCFGSPVSEKLRGALSQNDSGRLFPFINGGTGDVVGGVAGGAVGGTSSGVAGGAVGGASNGMMGDALSGVAGGASCTGIENDWLKHRSSYDYEKESSASMLRKIRAACGLEKELPANTHKKTGQAQRGTEGGIRGGGVGEGSVCESGVGEGGAREGGVREDGVCESSVHEDGVCEGSAREGLEEPFADFHSLVSNRIICEGLEEPFADYHSLVSNRVSKGGAHRPTAIAALLFNMDKGYAAYNIRSKNNRLQATVKAGERSGNYFPQRLFPIICIEQYYKEYYEEHYDALWSVFRPWAVKYYHDNGIPFDLAAADKGVVDFSADKRFNEEVLDYWLYDPRLQLSGFRALCNLDSAYRQWERMPHFSEVMEKGFSLPEKMNLDPLALNKHG